LRYFSLRYAIFLERLAQGISFNVPGVGDVFAAAIKKRVAFRGCKNVAQKWRGNEGFSPIDLAIS
jgi:hypothetical protein